MADRHVKSLDIGGGYGNTGTTLSATGTISANSAVVADGGLTVGTNTLAAARLTLNRTTSNVPFAIVDATESDSDTVITVTISDGASGANNVNGDQRIQFSDGTQSFSFGQARNAGVKSFNIAESGSLTTGIGFRLNADTSVDLPEGDVTAGTSESKQGVLDLEHGAATTKPGTLCLTSADGTKYYFFVSNAGDLKVHTSLPVNDSDGTVVDTDT